MGEEDINVSNLNRFGVATNKTNLETYVKTKNSEWQKSWERMLGELQDDFQRGAFSPPFPRTAKQKSAPIDYSKEPLG